MDDGHTLSPYSEVFEGRVTRRWAERIAGTKKMRFQLMARPVKFSISPPSKPENWPRLCRL
jgi:hypothetical protein